MTSARTWSWAALAGLAVPLALGTVPAHAATAAKPYDFNGDGAVELVVGAPGLEVGGHEEAGGVAVIPSAGLDGEKVVTQSTSKVVGASEDGDRFGSAVASADFDRDGYADLAVGQPDEGNKNADGSGAVTVLYGTAKGLSGKRSAQIAEPSGTEEYAGFGTSVAAGDVNGDGYPDLVVGAPDDDNTDGQQEDFPATGTVTVLFGSKDGVKTKGSRLLRGVRGTSSQDYRFGSSVAVADVDGGGPADVVVLAKGHYDDDDGGAFRGSASICSGATGGPTGCKRLVRSTDLQGNNTVVVGNVEGDARPEIVVGVPTSSVLSDPGHLDVLTLSGSGAGTSAQATRIDQDDLGVPGASPKEDERVDDFGYSVALGRVDADGYDDLAVGAPNEAVGDERAGRVVVVRGGAAGLATSGNTAYDQDTAGVPGGSEQGDAFGSSVSLVDRNADGKADLTVGAAGEDDDQGRVTTLLGTGSTITTVGADAFGLNALGYRDRFQAGFGEVLGR
jgi:hypothetical protein